MQNPRPACTPEPSITMHCTAPHRGRGRLTSSPDPFSQSPRVHLHRVKARPNTSLHRIAGGGGTAFEALLAPLGAIMRPSAAASPPGLQDPADAARQQGRARVRTSFTAPVQSLGTQACSNPSPQILKAVCELALY